MLWAVHISEGILTAPWCAAGFAVAAALALVGGWRMRDEEIPRTALLTAAFFVVGLLHVPVGPTAVHLLLTGLMGVSLGRRAALGIPVGLFLQAVLIGHGGLSSLGVNSCVMVLPALASWQLFALLHRLPWVRCRWFRSSLVAGTTAAWVLGVAFCIGLLAGNWGMSRAELEVSGAARLLIHPLVLAGALGLGLLAAWAEYRLESTPEFPLGLVVGIVAVVLTVLLNALALTWGAAEDWHSLALLLLLAHLPIALFEGVVLGFTVGLLAGARPELVGWGGPPAGTVPAARVVGKGLTCLAGLAAGLLGPAGRASAHALLVECELLGDRQVRVSGWYSARPRSFAARGAQVRVLAAGDRLIAQGQTDEAGQFVFAYPKEEPLTVEVYQLGHRQSVRLFDSGTPAGSAPGAGELQPRVAPGTVVSSAGENASWLKDVLLGVGFVLALAAFVLSVRNSRRLRGLRAGAGAQPPQ